MSRTIRFGVSLNDRLLKDFDRLISGRNYKNRSQAIADLIRDSLIERDWQFKNKRVAAIIGLVYDHHRRDLVNKIVDIQHDFQKLVISTQHIHLDHKNCLEIIAAKGQAQAIVGLAHKLRAVKGIKHASFTTTTSGKKLI
ncbi:MAG: nickel-responsive transcriptional regulator NikR [Candidatus Omnitrophota bacterium]